MNSPRPGIAHPVSFSSDINVTRDLRVSDGGLSVVRVHMRKVKHEFSSLVMD